MYSGTSSVPKISSGSKSRLKTKEGESWDLKSKRKDWEGKLTLEWFASLECCSPRLAVSPYPPWPWGFSHLEKQGEKTWGDGSVWEWIYKVPREVMEVYQGSVLAVRAQWEWWLAGVH
jgi:hypothetical protein